MVFLASAQNKKWANGGYQMDVQAIQDLISQAKVVELKHRHLRKQIHSQIASLHHTIELPQENASHTLFRFIVEYIDHVPVFLEGLRQASEAAGIERFINPFLDIAEENFLSPATHNRELIGLDVLLDKAYFAHRLIEEVNDQYLAKTGSTLIPINMTWSNLVVHAILGETFANELDTIIEQTVKQMMRSQEIYNKTLFENFIHQRNPQEWINLWTQWGCLSKKMDIELKFTAQSAG